MATATEYIRPNGDSSVNCSTFGTGSYHYDRLNESTTDDTDGIYATNATSDYVDYMTLSDVTTQRGQIYGIMIYYRAKYTVIAGTTTSSVSAGVRIGSTNYMGSPQTVTSSYALYGIGWADNPATSTNWIQSDINSLIIVMNPIYHFVDKSNAAASYISQVYVAVNYYPFMSRIRIF